jgi:polysaccharide biosynthesis/export protein
MTMFKQVWLVVAVLVAVVGCASSPSQFGTPLGESGATAMAASSVQPRPAAASPQGGAFVPAVIGLPPSVPASSATYVLGPGDLLQVDVFQVGDLSIKGRVNEGGVMVMPLIGPVMVGGLTAEEAGRRIADELQKDHVQNPQVSVLILESANMNLTVGGAVNKPGVFPMPGQTSLLQAISLAEGVTDVADIEQVIIFRTLPGRPMTAYVVDLRQVQRGQLADPMLAVNDKVMVPESGSAVAVKNVTGALRGIVSLNPFWLF